MVYKEIEKLTKGGRYDEALRACDSVLSQDPMALPKVCRLRCWIFTSQGKYGLGINEMERIIETNRAELRDFHTAAFWSLYDKNFVQAQKWFEIVLSRGQEENEEWFESSALFYLAYICMELGRYEAAKEYLMRSGDTGDDSTILIPNIGAITRGQLLQEIDKRAEFV